MGQESLDLEYLGQLIAGIAYLCVGLGLLRLALRTRQRPERLLGIYFVLTGFDYLFYTIPEVFGLDSVVDAARGGALLSYAVAVVALVMFTREVFRAGETWARSLTWLCSAGVAVGVAGSFALGEWAGSGPGEFFYWPYYAGYTGACVWVTCEALLAHTQARKRLAIGLCEPAVVNRYLLWGGFGALQVLACGAVLIVEVQEVSQGAVSRWADLLLSVMELGSVSLLWLAFFPPTFYREWLGTSGPDRETLEAS